MSHHHCTCNHHNLAYCKTCQVVYCKDCKKEWAEKVIQYWYSSPWVNDGTNWNYTPSICTTH